MRDCQSRIKSFNALRNALPHTQNATQARNSTASGGRATHPDFYCGISLANFLIFSIIRNSRQGFTLEIEEFLKQKITENIHIRGYVMTNGKNRENAGTRNCPGVTRYNGINEAGLHEKHTRMSSKDSEKA